MTLNRDIPLEKSLKQWEEGLMCYHRTIEDRSGKNLEESPTLSFCSKCIYPSPNGCSTNLFINHLSLIPAQHHQQKVAYIDPLCPLPQMQGNAWFSLSPDRACKQVIIILSVCRCKRSVELKCWQEIEIFKFSHDSSEKGTQNKNSDIFIFDSELNLI